MNKKNKTTVYACATNVSDADTDGLLVDTIPTNKWVSFQTVGELAPEFDFDLGRGPQAMVCLSVEDTEKLIAQLQRWVSERKGANRTDYSRGLEDAAEYIEKRAKEVSAAGNSVAAMMGRIFSDEAKGIRALETAVNKESK